ncbi:hypothetical protein FMM75_17205 [Lachnospiraceae bacterium MD335]|nr:hypothetical protein [Lachnospiraceae bacterium MD335]
MRQMTDYEMECLIAETQAEGLLQAPGRMKSEIMEKSGRIQTRAVRQMTRTSVRLELLLYGVKTAAAVATAIFLFGVVSHPALQSAIEQNDVWAQEEDGGHFGDVFSDALNRINRNLWQGMGGYQE